MNKRKEKAPVIISLMTGAKLYYTDIKPTSLLYSVHAKKSIKSKVLPGFLTR